MSINNLYPPEKQAEILGKIAEIQKPYRDARVPRIKWPRYFVKLAVEYRLVEKLEEELDRYPKGELGEDGPTSDLELAKFFDVRHFSVQTYLNRNMDSGKRNIKADTCLKLGRQNGWPHLRDSGKIPPLEGRVRDASIVATKKRWEYFRKHGKHFKGSGNS